MCRDVFSNIYILFILANREINHNLFNVLERYFLLIEIFIFLRCNVNIKCYNFLCS